MNLYRHVRTGRVYAVLISNATLEADETSCVVYQAIDQDRVWIRPSAEFHDGRFEKVTLSDIQPKPQRETSAP